MEQKLPCVVFRLKKMKKKQNIRVLSSDLKKWKEKNKENSALH
jgi:hypothetical protein